MIQLHANITMFLSNFTFPYKRFGVILFILLFLISFLSLKKPKKLFGGNCTHQSIENIISYNEMRFKQWKKVSSIITS